MGYRDGTKRNVKLKHMVIQITKTYDGWYVGNYLDIKKILFLTVVGEIGLGGTDTEVDGDIGLFVVVGAMVDGCFLKFYYKRY